jgi:hypothetical protein
MDSCKCGMSLYDWDEDKEKPLEIKSFIYFIYTYKRLDDLPKQPPRGDLVWPIMVHALKPQKSSITNENGYFADRFSALRSPSFILRPGQSQAGW